MDRIDELAQSMLARCASHGHSVVELDGRHAQEALRAELRRIARHWRMRVRTVATGDRVAVARIDEQPWDDDERAAIRRVNEALSHAADHREAGRRPPTPPPKTTSDGAPVAVRTPHVAGVLPTCTTIADFPANDDDARLTCVGSVSAATRARHTCARPRPFRDQRRTTSAGRHGVWGSRGSGQLSC